MRRPDELVTHEIAAFITHHALITVRKDAGLRHRSGRGPMGHLRRIWPSTASRSCSTGCWTISSTGISGRSSRSTRRSRRPRTGSSTTARGAIEQVQRRSFQLRKSLVLLRRITLPTREVVNTLLRHDLDIVPDPMAPYFRDVYDHVMRATEWTESLRDLVTTIVETNLTEQGNRMNLIMKKVTSWAAIIAVPTAITGWYGQNVPYPGFGKTSGLIASTVLIVGLAVGCTCCSGAKTGCETSAVLGRPSRSTWAWFRTGGGGQVNGQDDDVCQMTSVNNG